MRELHHWSKATHKNVQELIGIVMFQGRLGMVSRWMENGNLQEYLQKHPDADRYQLVCQDLGLCVEYKCHNHTVCSTGYGSLLFT